MKDLSNWFKNYFFCPFKLEIVFFLTRLLVNFSMLLLGLAYEQLKDHPFMLAKNSAYVLRPTIPARITLSFCFCWSTILQVNFYIFYYPSSANGHWYLLFNLDIKKACLNNVRLNLIFFICLYTKG